MGQTEIYELLKNKRLSGDNSAFSAKEIQVMLKDKGLSCDMDNIYVHIARMRKFGILEICRSRNVSSFRLHRKMLENEYL